MANFQDILNKPAASIEKPKPYPVGTYLGMIEGAPAFGQAASENKTDFVEFSTKILSLGDDVDPVAVATFQEKGQQIVGKTLKGFNWLRFYVTDDSAWRLMAFLEEHLGIEKGSKSLNEMLAEAPGKQFYFTVKHEATKDGSGVVAKLGNTAKV